MAKTTYMWDELSDNVAAEYEDGLLSVGYTHEPGLYGNLLSQNRSGVTSYYHYDGRGDTVALTDDSGNVTDTKEYDAWGNVIASTGSTVTPYQFVGRSGYQTGSTGLYVRARIYQPILSRWYSVDPLGIQDGLNLFRYARNRSVTVTDPSGELIVTEVGSYLPQGCGNGRQAYIRWLFELAKLAPCHGYIVQQVDVRCKISSCVFCPVDSPTAPDYSYWEAWEVQKNQTLEVGFDDTEYTDQAQVPTGFNSETCGNFSQVGSIKFFCDTTTHNLKALWPTGQIFGPEGCRIRTGGVLSTINRPIWWEAAPIEGPVSRRLTAFWNCCKCTKSNFAISDGSPLFE